MVASIRDDDMAIRSLRPIPIGDQKQVVLAVNLLEWTRGWRIPAKTFGLFGSQSRDILMRTGRPVSFVTLTDYLHDMYIRKWKHAVIPLPGLLTDAQRATLEKAFGKLPPIRLEDGALLLIDGAWSVLGPDATPQELWKPFATEAALKAGDDTIWYIGDNFESQWKVKP